MAVEFVDIVRLGLTIQTEALIAVVAEFCHLS